ncbi:diaminopimelate decarboxylase [Streptomyces sp. NPDC058953]|uniref:diaminopimelate decarboxylase n=1 Tax=unclassified Streptomyces TaxID=2593676 RepID=UPI0036C8AC8B
MTLDGRDGRPGYDGRDGGAVSDGPDVRDGGPDVRDGNAAPLTRTALDRARRRDAAVRAAVEQGLLTEEEPVVALLDTAGIRASAAALHAAFAAVTDAPVLHAFAVKAAPLVPVLALLNAEGVGAEVASPGELALARAAGVPAGRIVLDSPAKTPGELREALALGIAVNADNTAEVARLDALLAAGPTASPLGLRVNAQVGGGAISALSTATATSKFGFALRDEGARAAIVRMCLDRPWLTRLHTHSGSQGVPAERMAEGVREVYALAEEINAAAGRRQIDTIDIGGGLPVNFGSDEETPTYAEYARLLTERVPGLLDGRYGIVTEFGRSLLAKHGLILSRVEYAKVSGGRPIALTHAGVQVATRTVYDPESWPLRIAAYDGSGRPKQGAPVVQDVAGPACFAGDLLARARPLPPLAEGDVVAALDTGAYYFANHFGYNSLPRVGVYGFRTGTAGGTAGAGTGAGTGTAAGAGTGVSFAVVREAQTVAEIVAESGGDRAGALLEP